VRRALFVLAAICGAGTAHAEAPHGTYVRVAPTPPSVTGAPSSNLIYLHRCPQSGCPVTFGAADDSRTQTSSIVMGSTRTIGAFVEGDAVWSAFVACVQATYKPFNVTVTDVDPGNVPHYENLVGGKATDLRNDLGAGVIGVAPFNCSEIPNGISYTFDEVGPDADRLCWTAAQETAHVFGLEHEFLQADPMSYLDGPLPKRFQWAPAQCGELMSRACNCPDAMPSSYQLIQSFFGVGSPNPPAVAIDWPADGKQVQPGFTVRATAMDDAAIDHVELWIDGAMVASAATAPYAFLGLQLAPGPHAIEARAVAVTTLVAVADVSVTMGSPCTADRGCTGTDACVGGICVPGPNAQGGLGAQCTANDNCVDGLCASDGSDQLMYCAEPCDPHAKGSCPHGFTCATSTTGGLCWASGGCCSAGGDAGGSLVLAGALAGVLRRRRGARS
jgi:uncharacterized protein (TIGR03382 family)